MRRSGVNRHVIAGTALLLLARPAIAQVRGEMVTYTSPTGVEESCVLATRIPEGDYSEADEEIERAYCSIDFYVSTVALCPKIWSTSPGMIVHDISGGRWADDRAGFEAEVCPKGTHARQQATRELADFKTTMNGPETSATFAPASLLYYHFSRYFRTHVYVPPAVFRTMDREEHLARVSDPGVRLSDHRAVLKMNHAGWLLLEQAERDPGLYHPPAELFTVDRTRIHGVLLLAFGERYGSEINGTRASGWGSGQSRDFQRTPAFLALASELPLAAAVSQGLERALEDPAMRKALKRTPSDIQMVYWMKEVSDLTLLDFMFSQQDRIGNIEYHDWWQWSADGYVQRVRASDTSPPADIAGYSPVRVRRTEINDNDAGGRVPYANFTKRTGMLDAIRHYEAEAYRRLQILADDFRREGTLHAWLYDTFGLSDRQLAQVVNNTIEAAEILRETCRSGDLRFDLEPDSFLSTGTVTESQVECDLP